MARLTSSGRVLRVELGGDSVRAASGSMVAFTGRVEFKGLGSGGGDGLRAALKRRVAGESVSLMECSGSGTAYLAQDGQDVVVVDLAGEELTVESEHLLAVTSGLRLDVRFAGLHGVSSGQGLATTVVQGSGQVALLSEGPLFGLRAAPGAPVVVDPDAYVASRGRMSVGLVSGVTWRSAVGGGGGEPFSLRFEGDGTVLLQPAER